MVKQNVLVIHCDQLRQDSLSIYGNPDVRTPNLDALAQDSVVYQEHFTVYPICTPSRYSLWSGMYVHEHGAWDNQSTLPSGYATFPKVLRQNGYATSVVGKMHMNPTYQDIGFSEMQLAEQNGIGRFEDDYHRELMERGKIDRFDLHHQSDLFRQPPTNHLYDMCQCSESDLEEEDYSTEWITRKAVEKIQAWNHEQPNLLMVGYISPHHPFDPPAPYSTMYDPEKLTMLPGYTEKPFLWDRETNGTSMKYEELTEMDVRKIMAAYYGMITEIDAGIGRILQTLKETGLYDTTMIVFTSDHGEYMGYHHMMLKCNHLYEPLAKIPLVIKYPQQQGAGSVDTALSENIDIAPTVLQTLGLPIPATMQGYSLQEGRRRDFVFAEGQYGTEEEPCIGYMLRTERYKLLVRGSFACAMLYDLQKDPYELKNEVRNPAYKEVLLDIQQKLADFVLFSSIGKVYRDPNAPQIRDAQKLHTQAETMKRFIAEQWS